jgi:alpha-glucosidase
MRRAGFMLLVLCGCSSSASGPIGDYRLEFDPRGFAFTIHHASELSLTTAPARALAFRRADATYQMMFGSFLVSETPRSDWRFASRIKDVDRGGGQLHATVVDERGEDLAKLNIRQEGLSLFIRATAIDAENNRASFTLECDDPAQGGFLGFGSQSSDVDHRGQVVPIFVSEDGIGKVATDTPDPLWFVVGTRHQSYLAVPTMVAPRAGPSFGLHATTEYRSIWDLCATDPNALSISVWEGTIEIMISPGRTPANVIEEQTAHVGRAPLIPDWSFGVWMERIGGSDAVQSEAALLRQEHIPVSAIWSEDWRGGTRMGTDYVLAENWRWDQALYPQLPGLIQRLHRLGIKLMVYENTFVVKDHDVWADAIAGDHLVKDRRGQTFTFQVPTFEDSGLADLLSAPNRQWVKSELAKALALGVDGWMGDFGEWYPADPLSVAPSDQSRPEAAHHRYPVAWNETNQEAIAESGRDDVVVFQRSGYSGSQGKVQVLWLGDQNTNFADDDGLPTIIPMIMGLGVTGFPVATHDIAGYTSISSPPSTKELFFRWTILGALNPVMRTHHGRSAFANWRWSADRETIDHFRRWADLHTRLFPLWKGLHLEAHEHGTPILRPLALFDPGDRSLHGIKDQYMIGDQLLIAPVVTASTTQRTVVLPRGTWFDFVTGEAIEGPQAVLRGVPLTEAAIFARAGAIVPMLPEGVESLVTTTVAQSLDGVRAAREVRVWLGAPGTAREGEGGSYQVASASRPSGTVVIQGATAVRTSSEARAVFDAAPNSTVTITDRRGTSHTLSTTGLDPRATLRFDVRW